MKKIIMLLVVIMLTGCTVNYNVTIDKDNITENVKISVPMNEVDENTFSEQVSGFNSSYNIKTNVEDDNYIANLNRNFDFTNYNNSTFMNKCYDEVNITNTDSDITIKTSNTFHCIKMEDDFETQKVTVNIKTKLKVKDNNADEINGNTYTWIIDENNYADKQIYMQINKSLINVSDTVKKNTLSSLELIAVILIFVIPIIILAVVIWFKAKGKNEI